MDIEFRYLKSSNDKLYFFDKFSEIFYSSFKQKYFKNVFSWKYLKQQTSSSLLQQIIVDKKIIGYRGLWKVDNYANSFQCIDTCIHPNYQGKGIFKLSNKNLIDNLGSFYNYPNSLSTPGYIKSGWVEASKMNIYINRLENFEYCNWDEDFLDWRFVKHPYIKYYKTKTKGGYAIIRFKKNLPIHIESIKNNIELEEIINPILSFKYDIKKSGMKVKNAGSVLTYNFNGNLRSSYFDMI